jgi:hypothetical protein
MLPEASRINTKLPAGVSAAQDTEVGIPIGTIKRNKEKRSGQVVLPLAFIVPLLWLRCLARFPESNIINRQPMDLIIDLYLKQ